MADRLVSLWSTIVWTTSRSSRLSTALLEYVSSTQRLIRSLESRSTTAREERCWRRRRTTRRRSGVLAAVLLSTRPRRLRTTKQTLIWFGVVVSHVCCPRKYIFMSEFHSTYLRRETTVSHNIVYMRLGVCPSSCFIVIIYFLLSYVFKMVCYLDFCITCSMDHFQ